MKDTIELNNSAGNHQKDPSRAWYIGLIVLSIISLLGLTTVLLLVQFVPSSIKLEIKKAGMTVSIIGGIGLFILLLKMYLNAYTKIVKLLLTVLGGWIIVISSIGIYNYAIIPSVTNRENIIDIIQKKEKAITLILHEDQQK